MFGKEKDDGIVQMLPPAAAIVLPWRREVDGDGRNDEEGKEGGL